ncbi:hypothetical protein GE061_002326 [Apolygus lucorum]|uniref:Uncharacterized protein n=1 Tax=Apolygus lucorum TaxID=248454 RepID=A0A8S9X4T4_APOLU|nr:hypothetical protein GE061_002326 [Apolygus lucorum]
MFRSLLLDGLMSALEQEWVAMTHIELVAAAVEMMERTQNTALLSTLWVAGLNRQQVEMEGLQARCEAEPGGTRTGGSNTTQSHKSLRRKMVPDGREGERIDGLLERKFR